MSAAQASKAAGPAWLSFTRGVRSTWSAQRSVSRSRSLASGFATLSPNSSRPCVLGYQLRTRK